MLAAVGTVGGVGRGPVPTRATSPLTPAQPSTRPPSGLDRPEPEDGLPAPPAEAEPAGTAPALALEPGDGLPDGCQQHALQHEPPQLCDAELPVAADAGHAFCEHPTPREPPCRPLLLGAAAPGAGALAPLPPKQHVLPQELAAALQPLAPRGAARGREEPLPPNLLIKRWGTAPLSHAKPGGAAIGPPLDNPMARRLSRPMPTRVLLPASLDEAGL